MVQAMTNVCITAVEAQQRLHNDSNENSLPLLARPSGSNGTMSTEQLFDDFIEKTLHFWPYETWWEKMFTKVLILPLLLPNKYDVDAKYVFTFASESDTEEHHIERMKRINADLVLSDVPIIFDIKVIRAERHRRMPELLKISDFRHSVALFYERISEYRS